MSDPVLLDVTDGVATITLNRPDKGNALDIPLVKSLVKVVDAAASDRNAKVVLLRGAGRMFCFGGDLTAMNEAPARGPFLVELAGTAHEAVKRLATLDKVIVTAVQGSAAGAGLSLVLCSDLVISARTAKYVSAYASVGLTPDCGQSWLLPRVVGLGRALDLTLEPRRLSAEDALDWGIVTRIVEDDVLGDEVLALAKRLAAGPSDALGKARSLLRRSFEMPFDAHLDEEAASIAHLASTDEAGTLIDTFLAPR